MSRSSRFRVSCKKEEEEKINQKLLNKKIEKKLYNKEFIFVANSSERKKRNASRLLNEHKFCNR